MSRQPFNAANRRVAGPKMLSGPPKFKMCCARMTQAVQGGLINFKFNRHMLIGGVPALSGDLELRFDQTSFSCCPWCGSENVCEQVECDSNVSCSEYIP